MGNCSCIDRSAVMSWADDDGDEADWDEWQWTAAGAGSPGRPGKKEKQQQKKKNHQQQQQQQQKEHLLSQSPGRAEDPHHKLPDHHPRPAAANPASDAAVPTQEVKITISKRQLQELVRKAGAAGGEQGVEGLRRALEGLLGSGGWDWEQVAREAAAKAAGDDAGKDGHGHGHGQQYHWRPNLQSIPEGAE